ncbi:hypothetical protein GW17_00024542 [Ensete ventricosum]|nr:hypothetical protein GW17_00024542 [Ensete ventricosum]RZR99662.1 hypothetical protein BHM03_00029249 [Ensete ventricosum]
MAMRRRAGQSWPAPTQGRPPTTRASNPQGRCLRAPLATRRPQGLSPNVSPIASRGGGTGRKGGRLLAGRLPTSKNSRLLRRGRCGDGAKGARGKLGFSFVKRTILLL